MTEEEFFIEQLKGFPCEGYEIADFSVLCDMFTATGYTRRDIPDESGKKIHLLTRSIVIAGSEYPVGVTINPLVLYIRSNFSTTKIE